LDAGLAEWLVPESEQLLEQALHHRQKKLAALALRELPRQMNLNQVS
jgi:hypothetical protein